MKLCGLAIALVVLCAFAGMAQAQGDSWKKMLEKRTYTDKESNALPYRLLKPEAYDASKKYPLVLFLHGAGERGTDNEKQLIHGVGDFARAESRKKYPCFLAAPQCPTGKGWSDFLANRKSLANEPSEPGRLALELVAALQKEFSIDPDRLYITGLSMGGYGTWDLISRHPKLFAAAVPVCGGGDVKQAGKIAKMPIWVFHGALDPVVKPERSREMVEALQKAGGHPGYTEYPDVQHNSWVNTYQDPVMMAWLFAQKKK